MPNIKYNRFYILAGAGAILAILPLYYFYDPQHGGFPACPFFRLTGLYCTGCGSQRALHDLVHGHWASSLGHNLLLLPALALVIWHLAASIYQGEKIKSPLAAVRAPRVILWVILVFSVLRNLPWEPFQSLAP